MYSQNIGVEFDRKMNHAHNEKWEKKSNRRNRTTNQERIRMVGEKKNYNWVGKVIL